MRPRCHPVPSFTHPLALSSGMFAHWRYIVVFYPGHSLPIFRCPRELAFTLAASLSSPVLRSLSGHPLSSYQPVHSELHRSFTQLYSLSPHLLRTLSNLRCLPALIVHSSPCVVFRDVRSLEVARCLLPRPFTRPITLTSEQLVHSPKVVVFVRAHSLDILRCLPHPAFTRHLALPSTDLVHSFRHRCLLIGSFTLRLSLSSMSFTPCLSLPSWRGRPLRSSRCLL